MRLSLRTRHRHLLIATGQDAATAEEPAEEPGAEEPGELAINVGLANFEPAPGLELEPAEARFGFTAEPSDLRFIKSP